MGDWLTNMIAWIRKVRIANGFYTPSTLDERPAAAMLNQRDHQLYRLAGPLLAWRDAAEVVRKGTENDYVSKLSGLALQVTRLRDSDTSLNENAFIVDMTDREALIGKLVLVATEVAEAIEAAERGNRLDVAEEISDTYIRLNDIVGELGLHIQSHIEAKMVKNENRPPKHGKLTNL